MFLDSMPRSVAHVAADMKFEMLCSPGNLKFDNLNSILFVLLITELLEILNNESSGIYFNANSL